MNSLSTEETLSTQQVSIATFYEGKKKKKTTSHKVKGGILIIYRFCSASGGVKEEEQATEEVDSLDGEVCHQIKLIEDVTHHSRSPFNYKKKHLFPFHFFMTRSC